MPAALTLIISWTTLSISVTERNIRRPLNARRSAELNARTRAPIDYRIGNPSNALQGEAGVCCWYLLNLLDCAPVDYSCNYRSLADFIRKVLANTGLHSSVLAGVTPLLDRFAQLLINHPINYPSGHWLFLAAFMTAARQHAYHDRCIYDMDFWARISSFPAREIHDIFWNFREYVAMRSRPVHPSHAVSREHRTALRSQNVRSGPPASRSRRRL